ncbi:30S ribosomal protein S6, partial [Mycoplasmopsis synoviae]
MVLVGPKTSTSTVESFLKSVFHDDFKKAEKLERTELAYEINKTKHAQYFLVNLETERKNIAEFIRLSNINKEIW